jgi:hypothetical protein
MTHPARDYPALSYASPQIAQLDEIYDSKTDQTAQTDQHPETVGEFGALLGPELTSGHPELTSGAAQGSGSCTRCANHPSSRALQVAAERPPP